MQALSAIALLVLSIPAASQSTERLVVAPVPPVRPADTAAAPTQTQERVGSSPQAARLRAGLIEDNLAEPDFPIISTGHVSWEPLAPTQVRSVLARVEIQRRDQRVAGELTFSIETPTGRTMLSGTLAGLPGGALAEMPTARRGGAVEGEPLAGRILSADAARFEVELSDDPRDSVNNWRRLTQTAWLDLRVRLASGGTVVLTLEKARAGTDLLAQIVPASP